MLSWFTKEPAAQRERGRVRGRSPQDSQSPVASRQSGPRGWLSIPSAPTPPLPRFVSCLSSVCSRPSPALLSSAVCSQDREAARLCLDRRRPWLGLRNSLPPRTLLLRVRVTPLRLPAPRGQRLCPFFSVFSRQNSLDSRCPSANAFWVETLFTEKVVTVHTYFIQRPDYHQGSGQKLSPWEGDQSQACCPVRCFPPYID